jgi:hypothetical protein
MEDTLPKLYTPEEIEAEYGWSVTKQWRLRKNGKLKSRKIGGDVRYTAEDIADYINSASTEAEVAT